MARFLPRRLAARLLMLTPVWHGICTAPAQAMPMAPPADLGSGTSFEQAAAPRVAPPPPATQVQRVDEPAPAATLALGLALVALVRRQQRQQRG